jgi:hypothetical protein
MMPNAQKPKSFNLVCGSAIAFGALGVLGGSIGIIGLFARPKTPKLPTGASTLQQQATLDMQRELTSAVAWMKPYQTTLLVLSLIVSIGLIVGGALASNGKKEGRSILLGAFPGAAVLSIISGALGYLAQRAMVEIMDKYMKAMLSTTPSSTKDVQGMVQGIMGAAGAIGVALSVVWVVLKVTAFVAGTRFLLKPEIRDFFGAQAASAPQQATD